MNCTYCDQIVGSGVDYNSAPAKYDLGSYAPRCDLHWRYLCANCGEPAHFMALAYCPQANKLFCRQCALEWDEVEDTFWAWSYYFRYRSPWSGQWEPALDRLEYEGKHPLPAKLIDQNIISSETYLVRYPVTGGQWRPDEEEFVDAQVQSNWNTNAERWDAGYDEDGDRNRRYHSDEPMLALLGDVHGRRILDVGSGNGYLCRKLTKAGALMTGVELSDQFIEIALAYEKQEPLGITYHQHSASQMDFLADASFDKAVSNYVLMDIVDYVNALREVYRLLRSGGHFVVVFTHPCFLCGPTTWIKPAPDSPRRDDRLLRR
ncbi:class I SAM-dependent methyltransferase [Chloroflexi bacterium TSY]|nr:class I SAM-dependent methyltransferase [Chloroflexi bacterium TSY]